MRNREGFTLIEVIISLVLLGIVFVALTGSAARYAHDVSTAGARASAVQMANDRLERVQMHPRYGELNELYDGSETNVNGLTGATRETVVRRMVDTTDAGILDITKVTVTVNHPGLRAPVSRTTIVAAP